MGGPSNEGSHAALGGSLNFKPFVGGRKAAPPPRLYTGRGQRRASTVGLRPTPCAVAPTANSAHCRCKRRDQPRTNLYSQEGPERDRRTRKKAERGFYKGRVDVHFTNQRHGKK